MRLRGTCLASRYSNNDPDRDRISSIDAAATEAVEVLSQPRMS
jgi:hypothetical protein